MDVGEYNALYDSLRTYEDIERIAAQGVYERETLLILYTFKTVRSATKRYYRVKNRVAWLFGQWKNGTSIAQLAKANDFPPVLMGIFIAEELGISRKRYRKWLTHPDEIGDRRLRREINNVLKADKIYTPEGAAVQVERGRAGEDRIKRWLDKRNRGYRTEVELRGKFPKTVDFLLDEPLAWQGREIRWIESKASVGDPIELRKNLKSQLVPYTKIFGPGMVIYHFGFVTPLPATGDVLVEDGQFFRRFRD